MVGHLPAGSSQLPPGSSTSSGQFLWLCRPAARCWSMLLLPSFDQFHYGISLKEIVQVYKAKLKKLQKQHMPEPTTVHSENLQMFGTYDNFKIASGALIVHIQEQTTHEILAPCTTIT
jgi:hypothetical protein